MKNNNGFTSDEDRIDVDVFPEDDNERYPTLSEEEINAQWKRFTKAMNRERRMFIVACLIAAAVIGTITWLAVAMHVARSSDRERIAAAVDLQAAFRAHHVPLAVHAGGPQCDVLLINSVDSQGRMAMLLDQDVREHLLRNGIVGVCTGRSEPLSTRSSLRGRSLYGERGRRVDGQRGCAGSLGAVRGGEVEGGGEGEDWRDGGVQMKKSEPRRPYNRCVDVAVGLMIFARYGATGPEAEHDVIYCGQPYEIALAPEDRDALLLHGWRPSADCDCGIVTDEIRESGDYESVERSHALTCNAWEFFT